MRESVSVEMGTVGGNGEMPTNDKGMMTFNCEGLSVQGKELPPQSYRIRSQCPAGID